MFNLNYNEFYPQQIQITLTTIQNFSLTKNNVSSLYIMKKSTLFATEKWVTHWLYSLSTSMASNEDWSEWPFAVKLY